MATMYEIYDNHSYEYDELVSHEDYNRNLPEALNSLFDFKDKTIIELGVGTGRLTNQYIKKVKQAYCYDRSVHMINKAKINLDSYTDKIVYGIIDNNSINQIQNKADFVIEGWSFGHTVYDYIDEAESKIDELVKGCTSLLNRNGKIIILETLGTNTEVAGAPAEFLNGFYSRLEEFHGFSRVDIKTDYQFRNVEEASKIMCIFFGPEIADSVSLKNNPIVKEFTGLWYR